MSNDVQLVSLRILQVDTLFCMENLNTITISNMIFHPQNLYNFQCIWKLMLKPISFMTTYLIV